MPPKSLLENASAFAAECESLATMEDLARGVIALVRSFGYEWVASGLLGRKGAKETFHFANWSPQWLDLYLREGFMHVDPVPNWALRCGTPIGAAELCLSLPRGHPSRKVFEAGRPFGFCGGYIVPQRAANNQVGAVAFVGARDPSTAEDRFALRALAGVVFDRAEAMSGRAPAKFVPQPPPEPTARERECLRHLVAGRSTAQIAEAMKVSQSTVRFHVGNLKGKVGSANRAELAALAISLGLQPLRPADNAVKA